MNYTILVPFTLSIFCFCFVSFDARTDRMSQVWTWPITACNLNDFSFVRGRFLSDVSRIFVVVVVVGARIFFVYFLFYSYFFFLRLFSFSHSIINRLWIHFEWLECFHYVTMKCLESHIHTHTLKHTRKIQIRVFSPSLWWRQNFRLIYFMGFLRFFEAERRDLSNEPWTRWIAFP